MPTSLTPPASPGTPRRVLVTGATGFVGQAVLLALLDRTDDAEVVAIVRPRRGRPASERLEALLAKPAFRAFVEDRGVDAARAEFARRVHVVEGDLAGLQDNPDAVARLAELGPLHAAVHCASAVSFDLPIHEAFDTNVGGALGLYGALEAAGLDPHVVHVSTAYVGGSARGVRTEGPLTHRVDWASEMEWAHAVQREAELDSRKPAELNRVLRLARLVHGKEGPNAVAAAADEARRDEVTEKLVEAGRLRAQTLGWTDVYTFTKAMAERVAEERWAGRGRRLSVVRPSIIESSHAWPYPGWIDGYKVADPLIMAYGRGVLKEFPALPDSLLDVVPVDMVVGVVVALALGEPTRTGADAYYQVVSGTSNPLAFHAMVGSVRDFFLEHPQTDAAGRPIAVPTWTYRRGGLVEPMIGLQEKGVRAAELAASLVPRGTAARRWSGTLHKQRAGLATLRKYVDLYKNYTRSELVFDDRHTRELWAELGGSEGGRVGERAGRTAGEPAAPETASGTETAPETQTAPGTASTTAGDARGDALIPFDITAVDWTSYLIDHHLPAVVALTDEYSASKAARRESEAARALAPVAASDRTIAVFDLDGTLASATVVTQYLALQAELRGVRSAGGATAFAGDFGSLLWATPSLIRAERRDRGEFLRMFARRYAGVRVADLEKAAQGRYAERLRAGIRADALARIAEHRAAGHRTIIVTGVPEPLVAPLADLADELVATTLDVRDGVYTGYLAAPAVVDEARAGWLLRYAAAHDVDLAGSYGYGDSQADVTWLSLLGHPFAVEPDLGLHAEAKRSRWPILDWE